MAVSLQAPSVLLVGKESVGKTQLAASLAGVTSRSENYHGSTVECESYATDEFEYVDSPGIVRDSDAETTRLAVEALEQHDQVLLVAQATHLDQDLDDLLPLVRGKRGVVVVTYWDKVAETSRGESALRQIAEQIGVQVIPLDARKQTQEKRDTILAALHEARKFSEQPRTVRAGWRIEPRPGILEARGIGPFVALILLFLPAFLTVQFANTFAGWLDPMVGEWSAAAAVKIQALLDGWNLAGGFWHEILVGDYGLVTMGPKLLVWAVPTVLLYAMLIGVYKATGWADRINVALHPLVRPLGLNGRDVVRVVMGFGCNVPAVIATRSCSRCTRGTAIAAISFGAACSYQLPATMAVFAAAGLSNWGWGYLGYLLVTTLIYTRLTSPAEARSPLNRLVVEARTFTQWPSVAGIWREARGTLEHFFFKALPIFAVITIIASTLQWSGVLPRITEMLQPVMSVFRLPGEAALPVVVASLRKDGILLFLNPGSEELRVSLTGLQILTGVYLAGVLVPCLVTALTIAREQSWRFAGWLIARQMAAAIAFSLILAWGGWLLGY